ncbi:6137_t:CDS:1, partial [Paraglomus occultum]
YAMLMEILRVFGDSLKNGFVEAGHRGEIVARLVLILCWRQCVCVRKNKKANYTTTVKLKAFLKVLLGNSSAADIVVQKIGKELLDGKLFFTHFIPLQETPSQQTLRKLWKRCAAGILKRNQRGVDILLVLKLGKNNFTFVMIQVKNRNVQLADSKYKDDSTWKLTTRYVFQETDLHDCKLPYL